MKLGITVDPETCLADDKCLLEDKGMMIFLKDLQAESTETVGYFLFSHSKQNHDRLQDTIRHHLKVRMDIKEELSIRWQKIAQKPTYALSFKNVIKA